MEILKLPQAFCGLFSKKALAVHIAQIRPRRNTAVNPARCSNLGNNVFRILDVFLQNRDHRSVLLREELLRHRTAFFAHTHLFGVEQQAFHVTRWVSALHKGDGEEGTSLGTSLAPVVLKADLVLQHGVSVDGRVVKAESFTGVNEKLVRGNRVHAGSFGN